MGMGNSMGRARGGGGVTDQLVRVDYVVHFLLPSLASRMRPLPPEIEAEAEPHAGANSDEEQERDDGVAGADEDRRAPPRALSACTPAHSRPSRCCPKTR